MATLTVTSRTQVTFRKDILRHLGIKSGDELEVDLSPDGRAMLKGGPAVGPRRGIRRLAGRSHEKVATLEEIAESASSGWAGRR